MRRPLSLDSSARSSGPHVAALGRGASDSRDQPIGRVRSAHHRRTEALWEVAFKSSAWRVSCISRGAFCEQNTMGRVVREPMPCCDSSDDKTYIAVASHDQAIDSIAWHGSC